MISMWDINVQNSIKIFHNRHIRRSETAKKHKNILAAHFIVLNSVSTFTFFLFLFIWLRSFNKIWRCKITELLQDISLWLVSIMITHLPPCHFDHFQKKKKRKKKEMLINQIVCAYSANDHVPSSCKYFIAVKSVSIFWLAYF